MTLERQSYSPRPEDLGIGILFWHIREAVIAMDVDSGKIILWNPAAERMLGFSEAEAVGMGVETIIPDQFRAAHRAALERYRATGQGSLIESDAAIQAFARHRNGDEVAVEMTLTAIPVPGASQRRVALALLRDHSMARRLSEERVARVEVETAHQRLHDFLMQAPAAIAILRGPEHVYELANPLYLQIIGRRDESGILGKSIRQALPELEGQGYFELVEQVYRQGQPFIGNEMLARIDRRGDGVLDDGYFNFILQPFRGGEGTIDGIMIHAVEVTEQVRARETVAALLKSTGEGVYGIDTRGVCTFANEATGRMLGYATEELLGRNMHLLVHHHHPDGRPYREEDCPIFQARHLAQGVRVSDEVFFRRDGTSFPVEYASYPVREEFQETRAVVNFVDITDRRRAEEEIQRLNQDLARRAAELAAVNHELESFSYTVAHDLRAPLRAMDGFSRILLEDFTAQLPDDAKRYAQLVRDHAQQMGRLIDDLLTFARLGRQAMRRQVVAPERIVRQVLEDLAPEFVGRAVEIEIGSLPSTIADPTLLKLVYLNLLGNAAKFTRQRNPARIEVGAHEENGETVYVVRDNGVGFDMRYVSKLFGVFQRLHRSEEYEGTGVGLAIVQRVVARHGGRVWAEATPNEGARFFFTLPDIDPDDNAG